MDQNKSETDTEVPVKSRGPVAAFFLSGWENIVRLMASNALFVVFNIPAIAIAAVVSLVFVPLFMPLFMDPVNGSDNAVLELFLLLVFFSVNALVSGTLICMGPFQAGFAQVYKDIRNKNSVSFFTSFKSGLKTGWKKGLAAMFIGLLITPVILLAVCFYLRMNSPVGTVIGVFFIVLLVAFMMIQNFVYSLIVSTDLKLGKIYKNAILFLFIRFVPCLGAASVILLFYFVIPFILLISTSYLTLGIFVFLYSFIVVSWVQYFLSCFSGNLIDRYVISGQDDES